MNIKRAYDPHRDLLELQGLERPACSNTLVPRGSHHISSLWSPAVATRGNRWQMGRPQEPLKQARTVAVGCDRLPETFHGKEGVDGSSPSEGFKKRPAYRGSLLSVPALVSRRRTHFRHQLLALVPDNSLCRGPFRTRKLLDQMRVRRKHHGQGMASLLRNLDDA